MIRVFAPHIFLCFADYKTTSVYSDIAIVAPVPTIVFDTSLYPHKAVTITIIRNTLIALAHYEMSEVVSVLD